MMMSGPAPLWMAAVARVCRSFWLIRSIATSAPACLPNSLACVSNSVSAAGTKCDHCKRCRRVPCANAGARRDATIPSIPATPTAAEAARNCRRLTCVMAALPWARVIASVTHRSAQGQARGRSATYQRPGRVPVAGGELRDPGELLGNPELGSVPGAALPENPELGTEPGAVGFGSPVLGLTLPNTGCPVRGSIVGKP